MKKYLRNILAVTAALLVLLIGFTVSGALAERSLEIGSFFMYGADGGYLWSLVGRDVTVFDAETLEAVSSFSIGFDTKQIYPYEDSAYFVAHENGSARIVCTDMQGGITGEWLLDEPLNVYQAERLGDSLYMVVNPDTEENYNDQYEFANYGFHRLYSLHLASGEVMPIDNMPDIGCIAAAGDVLLCANTVDGVVYVYDAASGSITNEISVPGLLMLDASESGMAWYVMETWLEDGTPIAGIGCLDIQSGEYEMLHELPGAFSMRIAAAGGRIFTAFFGDTSLSITEVKTGSTGEALTLDIGSSFKYAVGGGYVWIFCNGHVTIFDPALENVISEFDSDIIPAQLTADADSAFIVTDAGQLVCMDIDGDTEVLWDIPEDINVVQPEIRDDSLVFISPDEVFPEIEYAVQPSGPVYSYSLETGELTQISFDAGEMFTGLDVNGGALYLYDGTELMIKCGNETSAITVQTMTTFDLSDDGRLFAYTGSVAEDGMLIEVSLRDGTVRHISGMGTSMADLHVSEGYIYIMDHASHSLTSMPVPEPVSKIVTLTIIGDDYDPYSPQMEYAVQQMELRHPEVSIEFETYGTVGDTAPLITSLMSGESRYDILILSEYGLTNTRRYYRAGALMDLRFSDEIMESYGKMIGVQGIFTDNDGIFAVPYMLTPIAWQVNEELFDHYGLAIPENGWTWDDFYSLGEDVERLRNEGEDIILLADTDTPFFLMQYNVNEIINGAPDYMSDVFTDNMGLWLDAVDAGLIDSVLALDTNALWGTYPVENALFTVKELSYSSLQDGSYILPPVYADYVGVPVRTWGMSINSNSENADLAAEFLALYISEDILKTDEVVWNGRLLKDVDACERFEHYPDEFYPTAENELFWDTAISNGVQYSMIGEYMYTQIYEWYPAILSGEMDMNEFVYISQEKADMTMDE